VHEEALGVGLAVPFLAISGLSVAGGFLLDFDFLNYLFPTGLFGRFGFVSFLLDHLVELGLLSLAGDDLG
jgi:hypothetical protein